MYKRQVEYGAKAPTPGTSSGTVLPSEFTAVFILKRLPVKAVESGQFQQMGGAGDNGSVYPVSYTHLDVYKRQVSSHAPD